MKKLEGQTKCVRKTNLFYAHLLEYISFTLVCQSVSWPYSHASRLLLAIWLLAAMILNTLYVSQVVGLLAFPIYESQPKTFKQLVNAPHFSWGFDHSGGNLFEHFRTSSNPVFQKIFANKEAAKDAIDCFQSSLDKNFACVTWAGVADYVTYKNLSLRHGKSPLKFADDITLFVPCGLAMPRGSILKERFDGFLGILRDSGQGSKWVTEDLETVRKNKLAWEKRLTAKEKREEDDGPVLLGLRNLLGIFYLYIVGIVSSLIGFLTEKIVKSTTMCRLY